MDFTCVHVLTIDMTNAIFVPAFSLLCLSWHEPEGSKVIRDLAIMGISQTMLWFFATFTTRVSEARREWYVNIMPEACFYAAYTVLYILPIVQVLYASIGMMVVDMKAVVPFGIFYILSQITLFAVAYSDWQPVLYGDLAYQRNSREAYKMIKEIGLKIGVVRESKFENSQGSIVRPDSIKGQINFKKDTDRDVRQDVLKELEKMDKDWKNNFEELKMGKKELKETNKEEYDAWEYNTKLENWPLETAIEIIKMESEPYTEKATDQFTGDIRVGTSLEMTEDFYAVAFLFEFREEYFRAIMDDN